MSRGRIKTAVGIYGTLGALAWCASAAAGRSPWHLARPLGGVRWLSLPLAALAGVGVGLAGVTVSRLLVRRTSWARALHRELRSGMAGLSPRAAAPLALSSALGEELCFRGALQPALVEQVGDLAGVAIAAALFGMVHVPWNRRLLSWTAMATVMGVIFGLLYLATGELLAPIAAHAVINHENLRFILAYEPPSTKPLAPFGRRR
jgi:membrane protease YdiL (CAAX protease family)